MKKPKVNNCQMWGMVNPQGHISPYSLRWTKKEVLDEYTDRKNPNGDPVIRKWSNWKRQGWQIIRVTVNIEP